MTFPTCFLAAPHRLPSKPSSPRAPLFTCSTATPPSPPSTIQKTPVYNRLPVVGILIDLFLRKQSNIRLARQFGPVYKLRELFGEAIVITDYNAFNECYKNSAVFKSSGGYPETFRAIFGPDALFILDGAEHVKKRTRVLPAFSPRLYEIYFEHIKKAADSVWDKVHDAVERDGRVVLKDVVKDHYFRSILEITSGGEYTVTQSISKQRQYEELRDCFNALSTANFAVSFAPSWKRGLVAKEKLSQILCTLIRKRFQERKHTIETLRNMQDDKLSSNTTAFEELRSGQLDLLTMLCASSDIPTSNPEQIDQKYLTDLADLVLLIWFAGYTTTSAATLCAIMCAGNDDEIWTRLQQEQDGYEQLTYKQVSKESPLLDSYINEVLRLYPPASIVLRKATQDTIVAGHQIKNGTVVLLDLWAAQRGAKYYPQPDKLIMDRFLKQTDGTTPPAISSFGAIGGAHFCVGAALARMSMKTTLASLLRRYRLEFEKGQNDSINAIPEMIPASGVVVTGSRPR